MSGHGGVDPARRDEQVNTYLDALCEGLFILRDAVQTLVEQEDIAAARSEAGQHLRRFDALTFQAAITLDQLGAVPEGWRERWKKHSGS